MPDMKEMNKAITVGDGWMNEWMKLQTAVAAGLMQRATVVSLKLFLSLKQAEQ